MANYALTQKVIDDNIRRNGRRAITGPVLNAVLTQMLSTLGIGGYKLGGVVSPGDTFVPGDADMFFFAMQPGTYADFGGFCLNEGEIGFLSFNGEWHNTAVSAGGSVDAYTKAESDAKFATKGEVQELSGNVGDISTNLATEIQRATSAESALSQRIDTIVQGRNVRDIVGNYAELEAYDTSTLGDNDIVMVLLDNTKSGHTTYYRWKQTEGEWEFIGGLAFTYTKTEIDAKFSALHIVLPTIPADAEAHPENYQELLAQVDAMVRGAGADASFKMPITDVGNVDVTYVKTNPAHIYLGVFADDRSILYTIDRTTSQPRTYSCTITEKVFAETADLEGKADKDKIVITIPAPYEGAPQETLRDIYNAIKTNTNSVFQIEGVEALVSVARFVSSVDIIIFSGYSFEVHHVTKVSGAFEFYSYFVEINKIADANEVDEKLTELQLKVSEKAKVSPSLTEGVQIATLTTENAQGQAVETPLYAPQGGGGSNQWQFIEERVLNADAKIWDETLSDSVDALMIVIEFKGTSQNTSEGTSSFEFVVNGKNVQSGGTFNALMYSTRVAGSIIYTVTIDTGHTNIITAIWGSTAQVGKAVNIFNNNGIGVNGIHLWASGYFGAGSTMKFYKR